MRHKYLVKVSLFPGAKVRCMVGQVQSTLMDDKPDHIIHHAEANDHHRSEKTSSQTSKSITELAMPPQI